MKEDLYDVRDSYDRASLARADISEDPIVQFGRWFEVASAKFQRMPNAMHLSTVSEKGQPEGRIVLLKSFSDQGFIFFTDYSSNKGQSIGLNNKVALTFYWPDLEQQVRIEGAASKISPSESDDYFYSRPQGSQLSAIASPQSQVITSYADLEEAVDKVKSKGSIQRPDDWGGYIVEPESIEFWQGRVNRLHDRIKFTKRQNSWQIDRLAP